MEPSGSGHVSSESQSLNDIQDYLANFNKEIQETGGQGTVVQFANGTDQSNDLVNQVLLQAQAAAGDQNLITTDGVSIVQQDDNTTGLIIAGTDVQHQDHTGQIIIQAGQGDVQQVHTTEAFGQGQLVIHDQTQGQYHMATTSQAGIVGQHQDVHHIDNSVVQVLQSVGSEEVPVHTDGHHMIDLQDAQLVAVQNAQDSSQPQYVAVQGTTSREEQGNLEILANASQANAEGQQVMLQNAGANGQYQTVTIVPSDVNQGGEVSYVLIVSQPDEKKEQVDDMDMSIYDFKEEPRDHHSQVHHLGEGLEELMDDTPKRVIKLLPKRPAPGTTQLMCNYCNYTSPKKYLLTRHMKTHSEERPHKCNICDRGFKTIASLTNHVNTHTGTKPHKCKECESAFTTSGELVRHVRYRHTHEKPHKCTECDYCSVELSKLKRHMRSHTGERPYQCPHCSYASPDTYKLKRHLRIHTGEKPYECDICHARFTQSNSLKAHRLIHSGTKPVYQCELCPTTCGRKTDLKIHIQKLHTSDKPLQCRKCGKSFPDRYTFKIHMKTHDGEKCFKCELCPYAALSERHLQSHLLTHTGEKPYECNQCDQAFRQKQLLKRHKNLYHTPDYVPPVPKDKSHECSECSKIFAHKGNLLRHMAMHDPESPMYQQMTGPEEGEILSKNVIRTMTKPEEQTGGDDALGQPNKTVMIEVTQEGSSQQMFLLMEVPEGTNEVTAEQLQQAQEAAARQAHEDDQRHQQLLDESIDDDLNDSSMSDSLASPNVSNLSTPNISTISTPNVSTIVKPNVSTIVNPSHNVSTIPILTPQKQEQPDTDITDQQHHDDDDDDDDDNNLVLQVQQNQQELPPDNIMQQDPEPVLIPADNEAPSLDSIEPEPLPAVETEQPTTPRRRGRPRKDSHKDTTPPEITPPISPRAARNRTRSGMDQLEDSSPSAKKPRRESPKKGKKYEVKAEPEDDELQRQRSEQIKKDIEECFGFDVDDE